MDLKGGIKNMNTAQASRYVFEHLLKESLICEYCKCNTPASHVPPFYGHYMGQSCKHGLYEEHDIDVPNMEANSWLIYKAEIAFMELPDAHIKEYRDGDSFCVIINTSDNRGIGVERTLLKAKLMAFASYIENTLTKESN